MNMRLLVACTLTWAFATSSSQAGPVFTFSSAPPSGSSSGIGNVQYNGVNNFSGSGNSSYPYGIMGSNTPMNSGNVYSEGGTTFAVSGQNSGYFDIGVDFTSVITSSGVNSAGGAFTFNGYLSSAAAAYFGLSASTDMAGTASITLGPSSRGGANSIGSLFVTFSPNTVPEPSGLVLICTGALGLMALGLGRARLGGRPA